MPIWPLAQKKPAQAAVFLIAPVVQADPLKSATKSLAINLNCSSVVSRSPTNFRRNYTKRGQFFAAKRGFQPSAERTCRLGYWPWRNTLPKPAGYTTGRRFESSVDHLRESTVSLHRQAGTSTGEQDTNQRWLATSRSDIRIAVVHQHPFASQQLAGETGEPPRRS